MLVLIEHELAFYVCWHDAMTRPGGIWVEFRMAMNSHADLMFDIAWHGHLNTLSGVIREHC